MLNLKVATDFERFRTECDLVEAAREEERGRDGDRSEKV
jgi:hypothetical protein